MRIVDINSKISRKEIIEKHLAYFKTFVKAVVDVKREKIALDAELHSDLEAHLLADGSEQENLWGINLYPLKDKKEDLIEYTALINIRPHQNNFSMEIVDYNIKRDIELIVGRLIYEA